MAAAMIQVKERHQIKLEIKCWHCRPCAFNTQRPISKQQQHNKAIQLLQGLNMERPWNQLTSLPCEKWCTWKQRISLQVRFRHNNLSNKIKPKFALTIKLSTHTFVHNPRSKCSKLQKNNSKLYIYCLKTLSVHTIKMILLSPLHS